MFSEPSEGVPQWKGHRYDFRAGADLGGEGPDELLISIDPRTADFVATIDCVASALH